MLQSRPRPLPSTPFTTYYSLIILPFDAVQSSVMCECSPQQLVFKTLYICSFSHLFSTVAFYVRYVSPLGHYRWYTLLSELPNGAALYSTWHLPLSCRLQHLMTQCDWQVRAIGTLDTEFLSSLTLILNRSVIWCLLSNASSGRITFVEHVQRIMVRHYRLRHPVYSSLRKRRQVSHQCKTTGAFMVSSKHLQR